MNFQQVGKWSSYLPLKTRNRIFFYILTNSLPATVAPVVTPEPEVYLEGKHLVRGKIVHTKVQESFYGYQAKMLVKTEQGHKLWGTLPSCVDFDYRGEVEFFATFDKGINGMSYYKRPTKVKVLSEITA
jgi:hypothetical protein